MRRKALAICEKDYPKGVVQPVKGTVVAPVVEEVVSCNFDMFQK